VIIDKGMLTRFLATVVVVGAIGYFAMYTLWPPSPVSRLEPDDGTIPTAVTLPTDAGADYFALHRVERDRERSARFELLREIMNNPHATPAARAQAQMEMITASTRREQERQIERLIIGQGFTDAIVVFGEGVAVAIVRANSMTEAEALAVAEMVCTISGLRIQNVRVRFRK